MSIVATVMLLAFVAGVAMPLGAMIARLEHIRSRWLEQELRHGVMAFGAGTLLSAVALVLVPKGIENLTPVTASLAFIGGGLGFMALDILLAKLNTPASQLAAMLADFIPESIALGATYMIHPESALLLALMIALQNLPEGFNAYRELRESGAYTSVKIIQLFFAMAFLGPLAAVIGLYFLVDAPDALAGLMLFAAGGILYSIFQDIAPKVVLERDWLPPMGAILGFVLGMLGAMLIG